MHAIGICMYIYFNISYKYLNSIIHLLLKVNQKTLIDQFRVTNNQAAVRISY